MIPLRLLAARLAATRRAVTPLPRLPVAVLASFARSPASRKLVIPWHVICCPWMASCLFWFGPIPYAEENMPPDVLSYSHENGTAIQVGALGQAVYLFAVDPEGDKVTFRWALSADGYQGSAVAIEDGSQLWLDSDERLDGQDLRCEVSDGINQAITFIWPIEVLP